MRKKIDGLSLGVTDLVKPPKPLSEVGVVREISGKLHEQRLQRVPRQLRPQHLLRLYSLLLLLHLRGGKIGGATRIESDAVRSSLVLLIFIREEIDKLGEKLCVVQESAEFS